MVSVVNCIISAEACIEELNKCLDKYLQKIDDQLKDLIEKKRLLSDDKYYINIIGSEGYVDLEMYYKMLLKVEAHIFSCQEFKNFINAKEEVNG